MFVTPRCLILVLTRDLAIQIQDCVAGSLIADDMDKNMETQEHANYKGDHVWDIWG